MPELPEVQTIVTALSGRIVGRTIARAALLRTDIITPVGINFPKFVTGRRIMGVTRRGKRIIIRLDSLDQFYVHLGMTGRLTLTEGEIESHTHLIITFDSGLQMRFRDPRRFGGIFWLGKDSPDKDLGPEPLTLRVRELAAQLARTGRPIKSALLDQKLIAGLGNIYADEALHAAGIHPLAPADCLRPEQIKRLNLAIKSSLRRAIAHGGSTLRDYRDAEGRPGIFQKIHRVYARDGLPCQKCGTMIERIVLSGRSTCFCPKCQVKPSTAKRSLL
jgi:formamidopyrimidine-DNA glycosylase